MQISSNEAHLRQEINAIIIGFCLFLIPALVCTGFLVAPSHLAAALLWSLASLAAGASVGFLFGIPHVLRNESAGSDAPRTKGNGYRQSASTSLEQIADWLTKAIVGVALVELKTLAHRLWRLAHIVGDGLGGANAAQPAALAVLICFGTAGFLGGYLLTRLYLSSAFGLADQIATLPITETQRAIVSAAAISIETDLGSETPTLKETDPTAVQRIASANFESFSRPEDMAIWAKVQLEAGNTNVAVLAYAKALSLRPDDEQLHFEHAVAMARAGHSPQAVVAELETSRRLIAPRTDHGLARRIVTNLVYQCLYLPLPQSFTEALKVGEGYLLRPDYQVAAGAFYVNMACAFGQKVRWLKQHGEFTNRDAEIEALTEKALAAAKNAVNIDPRWKERIRSLRLKDDPLKRRGDDDLEVFAENEGFTNLLAH